MLVAALASNPEAGSSSARQLGDADELDGDGDTPPLAAAHAGPAAELSGELCFSGAFLFFFVGRRALDIGRAFFAAKVAGRTARSTRAARGRPRASADSTAAAAAAAADQVAATGEAAFAAIGGASSARRA